MKERLVGAAVLVAIGVWLIPWVLDGPESSLDTASSSLQLPAAEEPMPMRTQMLRLGNPSDELNEADEPVAETQATGVAPPSTNAPADRSEPPVAAARSESSADDTSLAAVEPSRPAATAPRKPPPAAAVAVPAGDWVVQLGSFGEEANARRLAQRASTFGYKAEVSSVRSGGRTLYRVRVGPAVTRAQADATASALRTHGVNDARVVAADR